MHALSHSNGPISHRGRVIRSNWAVQRETTEGNWQMMRTKGKGEDRKVESGTSSRRRWRRTTEEKMSRKGNKDCNETTGTCCFHTAQKKVN